MAKRERQEKQENLGPSPILLWGMVLVLLVVLFFLINSSLFNVSQITVTGNSRFAAQDIINASGINYKTNILHVDEYAAKENIEKNAYIIVEDIKRIFPTKVRITVRERNPVAQIGTVNGYYVIDKEGIALTLNAIADENLTSVYNLAIGEPVPAQKIVADSQEKLDAMFYVLEAIETYNLQGKIKGIDLIDPQKIMLIYEGNIKIQIGGGATAKDRLKYLQPTIEAIKDKLNQDSVINMESSGGYYIS